MGRELLDIHPLTLAFPRGCPGEGEARCTIIPDVAWLNQLCSDRRTSMKRILSFYLSAIVLLGISLPARAQNSKYDELANTPFTGGYPSKESIAELKDELLFQRGVQAYIGLFRH